MHTYARESENKIKKQFSRVTSHDLHRENKTYKLNTSIRNTADHILFRNCLSSASKINK